MAKLALQNAETLEMFIHRQIQASASGYGPSLSPTMVQCQTCPTVCGSIGDSFFQPHPYCLRKSPSYLVNSQSTDMFAGSLPILRVKSNWLTSYKEYMFAGIERFANEILVVG